VPLFDFHCQACGAESELLVRGSDPAPTCPACGSEQLERLPALPAVRSEATREVMLRGAKKRDATQARERIGEQAKYERNHD
jgi:putative FmdB family regulatory protein